MRNTLSLKCIPALACVLLIAGGIDAGERTIRPRRSRPLPRILAPIDRNGVAQAPLRTLTPPDSALLPFNPLGEFAGGHGTPAQYAPGEAGVNPTKNYQEPPENPPARPEEKPESPVQEDAEDVKDTAAKEPGQDSGALTDGLPPFVPYEQYQGMNQRRQDFDAPFQITGKFQTPRPAAPGAAVPPAYREIGGEAVEEGATLPAPEAVAETAAGKFTPLQPLPEPEASVPEMSVEESVLAKQQPAPEEVDTYRRRLETRLLEKYNNLPEYSGEVAKVTVVLSKPLQPSLDGTRLRAEFDQLVQDHWGKRIPALEKEYYVVTFGSGGVRQVRSDPSIRVGLNLERTYSEPGPDSGIDEKIRRLPADHAFRAAPGPEAPKAKMPDWWRPEFVDDGY